MRKTIVITGASDGIGAAAARRLSADGHQVVLVGHTPSKVDSIAEELGAPSYVADFARLGEVRGLVQELLDRYSRIDVLANNAGGVWGRKRRVTPDGHEITFQVNYLAGFLLTTRLLSRLLASHATVIFTSSIANSTFGHLDIDDLDSERHYEPRKAYGDSKLAQILFMRELHRRYGERGLAAVAFHPGNVATNFSSSPDAVFQPLYHSPIVHLWTVSPEKGADTLVWLAEGTAGVDFAGGQYLQDRKVIEPNEQANDPILALELWERSESMVQDAFAAATDRSSAETVGAG